MANVLRMVVFGLLGFVIVSGLFILMFHWISHDSQSVTIPSNTKIKVAIEQPQQATSEALKPISNNKQLENTSLQQAPKLGLTDTGMFESGNGLNGFGNDSDINNGVTGAQVDGLSVEAGHLTLPAVEKFKAYDHRLKFPQKALQAGVLEGKLVVRAEFDKNHEFQQFEIIEEQPVNYFRGILYQLEFTTKYGIHLHLWKHRGANQYKKELKDTAGVHHSVYEFFFDHNSDDPVRIYITSSHWKMEAVDYSNDE